MAVHPIRFMLMILAEYPIFVRNDGIFIILIENSFFYDKICTELVEALERNHYNGCKVIPISFGVKKSVVVDPHVEIQVNLLSITLFHNVVTTKFVPVNPKGDLLELLGGDIVATVQPIIPYSRPFKRPLKYLEYKKVSNLEAHVRVFKANVKVNDKMVDEEITIDW